MSLLYHQEIYKTNLWTHTAYFLPVVKRNHFSNQFAKFWGFSIEMICSSAAFVYQTFMSEQGRTSYIIC